MYKKTNHDILPLGGDIMKSKILRDLQLELFKQELHTNSDSIILTINDEKKNAYYVLNGIEKHSIDYWYAVLYF